jgi:hypothetical protein
VAEEERESGEAPEAFACAAGVIDATYFQARRFRDRRQAFVGEVILESMRTAFSIERAFLESDERVAVNERPEFRSSVELLGMVRGRPLTRSARALADTVGEAPEAFHSNERFAAALAALAYRLPPATVFDWVTRWKALRPKATTFPAQSLAAVVPLFALATDASPEAFAEAYEAMRARTALVAVREYERAIAWQRSVAGELAPDEAALTRWLLDAVTTAPDGSRKLSDDVLFPLTAWAFQTGESVEAIAKLYGDVVREGEGRDDVPSFVRLAVADAVLQRGMTVRQAYDLAERVANEMARLSARFDPAELYRAALDLSLGGGLTPREAIDLLDAVALPMSIHFDGPSVRVSGDPSVRISGARAYMHLVIEPDRRHVMRVLGHKL